MISLPDSNNICNPRVAITDANTTIPCPNISQQELRKEKTSISDNQNVSL